MNNEAPMNVIQRHWHTIPVPVYRIIEEVGIDLQFKTLDDDISGWIEREPNGNYAIVVNTSHATSRQRFTAAHELGHYIYHRDLLGDGVGDNRAYRAAGSSKPNPMIRLTHERQANSFAANLLMPKHALAARPTNVDIGDLAREFGVSEAAMKIRLGR
jgi:Zn-dependent peptidase ImmA (M78 family)